MSLDVLYVRSLFRPADFGGNRYPWEVTKRLAERGHRVRVVTPRPSGPLPGPTAARLAAYPASRRHPLLTFLSNAILSHVRVELEHARSRADVVVLSSYEVSWGHYALPGRSRTVPSVFIYHSRFSSDAAGRVARRWPRAGAALARFMRDVERLTFRSATRIVAVAPFSEQEIRAAAGLAAPITVIPTGVDTAFFHPGDAVAARERLGIARDARVLLSVGRLVPVKRYDRAIAALGILRRADPRYLLVIAGNGPERPALERLAGALGVREAVIFAGFREREELRSLFWSADLQLCTSDFENWSLALLEGLACGVPVVGVPTGGIPALLGLVDERLVAPSDGPQSVADTALIVLSTPGLRDVIGERAREVAVGRFDWRRVIDSLEDCLRDVVARGPRLRDVR